METRPIDIEAFQRVHYYLGLALWQVQAFEDTLCFYIAIILKMPSSRAEAEAKEILEKLQSRTLGQLITELRKANSSSSVTQFEQRVNRLLSERNWLAHSSWRENHGVAFSHPDRAAALCSRLNTMTAEASELQKTFVSLVHGWMVAQGFSEEQMNAEKQRILKERGAL